MRVHGNGIQAGSSPAAVSGSIELMVRYGVARCGRVIHGRARLGAAGCGAVWLGYTVAGATGGSIPPTVFGSVTGLWSGEAGCGMARQGAVGYGEARCGQVRYGVELVRE